MKKQFTKTETEYIIKTINHWKWLRLHPTAEKYDYPLIDNSIADYCFCCHIFMCKRCPLKYSEKPICANGNYIKWCYSNFYSTRIYYATKIINRLKKQVRKYGYRN